MQNERTLACRMLSLLIAFALAGCGTSKESQPTVQEESRPSKAEQSTSEPAVSNPRDVPLEPKQTATVTVYSTPSDCMVFVDSVPVRTEGDSLAMTPCKFTVPRGEHVISVEKPGGVRKAERIHVNSHQELEFDVSSSSKDFDEPSLLNAPLFDAAVGRSIPLDALNSPDRELDPFLSADGLTIYFVSDRGGLRGVYTATRRSPYHDFGEPAIVPASSGADMPASPSTSDDGLLLIYAVAEKSRLWQLSRTDPSAPLGAKEITRSDEDADRAWRSAQLSGDGLRLYWTEEGADGLITRAAVRPALGKLFGKTLAFDLPGRHPHLTADGLRQFVYDGKELQRSRRGSVKQPFGQLEMIAELQLENFTASPRRRQFWVTEDEQWMIYCDNPEKSGDLYVVRLSDGPGWGRQYVATPVAEKMPVAKTEPEEQSMPASKPTETVDLRSLPLPYTKHWTELSKLLGERQSEQAIALVRRAQQDRALEEDRQLLAWDLEAAESQAEFDREVGRALAALKPGATLRVGGTRFEFVRAEGDVLHLKVKDKEVTRKPGDLTPGELVSLADSGAEKGDAARALRFGTYLYFQGSAQHSIAESWFKRAGADSAEFYERLAQRSLHQAQHEFARGNLAAGMRFLDAVTASGGANTSAAREAEKERNNVYDRFVWTPVGPRKWERGEMGEFIADATRSNGSYLKSDEKYGDFELSCEWRVSSATANGGIYFRYSGAGKPLENGAKIHLAGDWDLKKMDRFATGALFASTAPSMNASLPEGKWNTLRIQTRGTAVQAWINDKEVLQATLGKGVPSSGFVMLDGAAGGISYRKVLLFELAASP